MPLDTVITYRAIWLGQQSAGRSPSARAWSKRCFRRASLSARRSISEARIGLVNMGNTALRARATEQALVGQPATVDGVRAACDLAGEGTNPPSDLNGDADYRKHLATVLTRRAVLAAAEG